MADKNRGAPRVPTGPLTEEQITKALGLSGFPLEVRLLQAFSNAGCSATVGQRYIPGDGEQSAEVDITTGITESLANNAGVVTIRLMVEAKQFLERHAFVALKWKRPTDHGLRAMRTFLSGRPHCGVLTRSPNEQRLVQLMLGDAGIAHAFDALNEPTVCCHWTEVRDKLNRAGESLDQVACQDHEHRESFLKLLRVVTWLEEDNAAHLAKSPGTPPLLHVQVVLPMIVISTPSLFVYDPLTKSLDSASSVILEQSFEAQGRVHRRLVDVVTETGLADWIARAKATHDRLREQCDMHAGVLAQIAHTQRPGQEIAATAKAMAELNCRHTSRHL